MLRITFHSQMPEIWTHKRKTCKFNIVLNEVLTAKMSILSAYIFENTERTGMYSTPFERKKCGENFKVIFTWGHEDIHFVSATTGPGGRN